MDRPNELSAEPTLRQVLDHTEDLILIVGADLRCRSASTGAAQWHGIRLEETVGRLVTDVLPVAPPDLLVRKTREVFDKGQSLKFDVSLKMNGTYWRHRIILWPMRDNTGRTCQVVCVVRNLIDGQAGRLPAESGQTAEAPASEIRVPQRIGAVLADGEGAIRGFFDDLGQGRLRLLSSAVEQSSEGIAVCDLEGDLLFVNKAFAAMHGYAPEELVGKHLSVFHTPEQIPAVEAANRQIRDEGVFDGEIWHARRDGTVFPTLMHNSLLRDEAGRPIGMIGTLRNITDRKRAEEQLRMLANAVQQSIDGIAVADLDGVIRFVNPAWAEAHGYTVGELLGQDLSIFHTQEQMRKDVIPFNEQVRKNGAHQGEVGHVTKDGTTFPTWMSTTLLRDEEGNPVGFVGTARNITERKRAEAALRESETRYRTTLDSMGDSIHVVDADRRILLFNPALKRWCEELGLETDAVGRTVFEAFPFLPDKIRDEYDQVFNTGKALVTEERNFVGGREIITETRKIPVIEGRRVARVVTVVRDITGRKRAEEARLVFSRSIEQSSDAIIITGPDRRITLANKAAGRLCGYAAKEMLGREPQDVFRMDAETADEVWTALGRDHRYSGVFNIRHRDGSLIPVETAMMLITDEHGRPIAAVGQARDVRESRRLVSIQQMAEAVAGTEITDEGAIQRIMSHLPELAGLDHWAIYLHNPEKDVLELRFCSESGRELAEAVPVIPVSAPLSGQVFRDGEIVFTPDVGSDDRFTKNPAFRDVLATAGGKAMRATCILPLRSGGRILGTLYLSDGRVRNFTPDELSTLKTLASQIGLLLGRTAYGQTARSQAVGRERLDLVDVVAESEAMKLVLRSAQRIAKTNMPTVILGPTGSGKGHLAKYIHSISPRADGPFLTVNCACLDGELILSEMFGHERGAFTGAVRQQKGCFELANGGTLLLDEMVELPPSAQAKLLQLVETQQFRRLGGQQTITTDVRIVCTTNADVRECVRSGKLRQDLYYRLNAAEIVIPPLGERPEDVRPLALAYLRTHALTMGEPVRMATDGALARLREYHWPGSVRELQNVLASAVSHGGQVIGARDLRFTPVLGHSAVTAGDTSGAGEREIILAALRRNRWNRTLAAEELGIHRNTLRNRMRKYGIFQ